MIESVVYLSREESMRYQPCNNEAIISIIEPELAPVNLSPRWSNDHILRLTFHDVDIDKHPEYKEMFVDTGEYDLMTLVHAVQIVDFIEVMEQAKVQRVVVACLAGVSRSAGVAMAIAEEKKLPFNYAYRYYNQYVRRLVAEEFARRRRESHETQPNVSPSHPSSSAPNRDTEIDLPTAIAIDSLIYTDTSDIRGATTIDSGCSSSSYSSSSDGSDCSSSSD